MQKKYKYSVFLTAVFLLSLTNIVYSGASPDKAQLNTFSAAKQISFAVSELGKGLGRQINPDLLECQLGAFPQEVIYGPHIKKVLDAVRQQGIFLNAFRLKPGRESLSALRTQGRPFIAYLKKEGYCLVDEIADKSPEGFFIRYTNITDKTGLISEGDFLNRWNGHIFSLPLVNIMAERLSSDAPRNGRVIFVYSYHKEDFEKLRKILEGVREEAAVTGGQLIYIDELGLIPKDSVKRTQDTYKLNEKEAFERARKSLAEEIERFARGISTYDENPFYQAQYAYLARHKITSYMEELDYDNWRHIVRFDDLNIHNKAVNAFCRGDTKTYLKKLKEYNRGFWLYNVKERDEIFRQQVRKITANNPGSIIFILRGIGHYGMEEKLDLEDFSIETYVIAEGDFKESLVSDQMSQVMLSNGVNISPQEERIFILRSFPEECLRTYFQKSIPDLTLATRLAKRIVSRFSEKEIKRLSRDISYAFARGTIANAEGVWEYVFRWAQQRGKIIPQEIPCKK